MFTWSTLLSIWRQIQCIRYLLTELKNPFAWCVLHNWHSNCGKCNYYVHLCWQWFYNICVLVLNVMPTVRRISIANHLIECDWNYSHLCLEAFLRLQNPSLLNWRKASHVGIIWMPFTVTMNILRYLGCMHACWPLLYMHNLHTACSLPNTQNQHAQPTSKCQPRVFARLFAAIAITNACKEHTVTARITCVLYAMLADTTLWRQNRERHYVYSMVWYLWQITSFSVLREARER